MRPSDYPDSFVVINGPEDGTEFPVVRAPFYVGRDPSCAVNVRLDEAVRPFHAHVSVVSDGYRVRRFDAAPVYVNGKRAGMIRSRIVRSGGQVRIGDTLLCLECAPEGLANRSHGMVTQSDLAWALAQGGYALLRLSTGVVRILSRLFGRILGSWVAIGTMLVMLYLFWPGFRYSVQRLFYYVYFRLLLLVT